MTPMVGAETIQAAEGRGLWMGLRGVVVVVVARRPVVG